MLDRDVETQPWAEQLETDDEAFRAQLAYLFERSGFYRQKLSAEGIESASEAEGLAEIAELPLTDKEELRDTEVRNRDNPIGAHLCVERSEIVRTYSTSGTSGAPAYIPLTAADLDNWVTGSARSYGASGVEAGQRLVTSYNAGPFVAAAALDAFERIGLSMVPLGTGNTTLLLRAIVSLEPEAAALTPSYASYLLEAAEERGLDLRRSGVKRVMVAGEPGGGEPAFRKRLEDGWGARVTEAMGVGDIGPSLFGECDQQDGMHLGARGFVHAELIDPASGKPIEMADGAEGELVLTHLRHQAAPLLRFRTHDHVVVWTGDCPCGRTAPRIRCIGRTDDMLIVRGVNVFPTAVRELVGGFGPRVSGRILVKPSSPGPKQDPPLPIAVEMAEYEDGDAELALAIATKLRDELVVQTQVELVPWGTLQRSEYKSTLVER